MGAGYSYRCSKCGEEYTVTSGIGMLFPITYTEIEQKIKDGKFGEEWKNLFEEHELTAVDCEASVYCCSDCNRWSEKLGMSLYVPRNKKEYRKKLRSMGISKAGPLYVTPDQLKEDFKLLKPFIHNCEKCGKEMHEATSEELEVLPCPFCGGAPVKGDDDSFSFPILWD